MDNENKGFPNGWGDNSDEDDDYGFIDDADDDDEDSAWGNSSSPFKKNEPVSSSDTNSKTNSQSNSVTSNANNNACVASIHNAPVQNIKQPESISSPAPTLNSSQNQGYVIQKQKKSPVLIMVIIALVLVVGVLVGVLFMMSKDKKSDTSNDNSAVSDVVETTAESTEAPTESDTKTKTTTTKVEKTTEITTSSTVKTTQTTNSNQYQKYKDKILASVNNGEYAGKDSHIENAPADMVFYDIDGTLSQISLSNAVLYAGPGNSYDEVYITRTSETFNIVGENSDWYYLMFYTGMGRFSHMTYGYANKKTFVQNSSQPTVSASIEEVNHYPLQGMSWYLNVSGDYSSYYYEAYSAWYPDWDYKMFSSGTTTERRIELDQASVGCNYKVFVTPYNSDGIAGETVVAIFEPADQSAITPCTKYGQIKAPSGSPINGYTTDYIVNNGIYSCVRTDLMNNWHVTAVNSFSKNGTTWYELYDTDDGDYYGWLDGDHIDFY